jgi:hypothetical protein
MGIIESIPVRDGLVFAWIPAMRSLLDQSSYAAIPTQVGSPKWYRQRGVDTVRCQTAADYFTFPHSSALDLSAFSCHAWGVMEQGSGHDVLWKKGTGSRYQFYANAGNLIYYDGLSVSLLSANIIGAHSIGCQVTSGQKALFYKEGVGLGEGNNAVTVPTTDDILLVGGQAGPSVGYLAGIVMYDASLTADKFSLLHAWSESLRSPSLLADRRFFDMGSTVPNGVTDGEVVSWDLGETAGRTVADKTGNGKHLDLIGNIAPVHSEIGRALECDGVTGYAEATTNPTIPASGHVEIVVLPKDVAAVSFLFAAADGTRRIGLSHNAGSIRFSRYTGADWHSSSWTGILYDNEPAHFVCVWTPTTVQLYVDGEPAAGTNSGAPTSTQRFVIGIKNDLSGPFKGVVRSCVMKSTTPDAGAVAAKYREFARHVEYDQDLSMVRPTLEEVTAGLTIPGTDYQVASGSYSVREDAALGRKLITCETDGDQFRPQPHAFGSWHFGFRSQGDPSTRRIYLISDVPGGAPSVGGYSFTFYAASLTLALQKFTPGAVSIWATAAGYVDHDVYYEVWISRNKSGVFTAWIKGGTFVIWTLIDVSGGIGSNPVTEDTVTTSVYRVVNGDGAAGWEDQTGLDRKYRGAVKP